MDHGGEVSHDHLYYHGDPLPDHVLVQVLHSASRAVQHGGELVHHDHSFMQVWSGLRSID